MCVPLRTIFGHLCPGLRPMQLLRVVAGESTPRSLHSGHSFHALQPSMVLNYGHRAHVICLNSLQSRRSNFPY